MKFVTLGRATREEVGLDYNNVIVVLCPQNFTCAYVGWLAFALVNQTIMYTLPTLQGRKLYIHNCLGFESY